MAPRFSVLLPTHNRADVLGYAIGSVLRQTEPSFELLIVGDGCTDGTAAVVASFRDERIRWFDLPKAPHFGYANRNIALRQARGEFIALAAHDDLLFPDHLALMGACLETKNADWAYSRPLWVSTDGTVVPFAINLTNADELAFFLNIGNHIPASCVVHRRSCLEAYGYWPEDVAEAGDWRLWTAMLDGGARLAYCRAPTTLHFKADWRKGRTGLAAADFGVSIAEKLGGWPQALKLDIPRGVPEQRAFYEAMTNDRAGWINSVRAGTEDALERLAWVSLRQIAPPELNQERELRRLSQELRSLRSSRSWRLTRPLRTLKERLGKWLG
jgi:glycosyltransferase involved in cell wall biosynthesis